MRQLVLALLLAGVATTASAQYSNYRAPSYSTPTYQAPRTTTTYDWQSGNSYTTATRPGGGATINGYNMNTGSMWNTQIDQRGNQQGTDANGNMWNYDARSKTYMNYGTGKMCTGEGYARICN